MKDNFWLLHLLVLCSEQIACSLASLLFKANKYLYAHYFSPRILRCLFTGKHSEFGSVVHAYTPNPWEAETGASVWIHRQMVYIESTGQPGLYTDNVYQTNKHLKTKKKWRKHSVLLLEGHLFVSWLLRLPE